MIKIYSYEDSNLRGALFNFNEGKAVNFQNLTQLLLEIDRFQERIAAGVPAWRDMKPDSLAEEGWFGGQKAIANFKLEILFTQNSTWQGQTLWLETGKQTQFRSVLELVRLLNEALEEKDA